MPAVEIERLLRLPRRAGEVWQGGLVRMPAWVSAEGREPFRPMMALWVDPECGKLHPSDPMDPQQASPAAAFASLVELACNRRHAFHRPGCIEVNEPELARYLEEQLSGAEIEVVHREQLAFLDEALDLLRRQLDEGAPLGLAAAGGVDPQLVRGFAAAAAEFYRVRPWDLLTDEDRIEIESPVPDPGLQRCVVLGAGDTVHGLGLFPALEHHDAMQHARDRRPASSKIEHWAVLFGPIQRMPFADADLWQSQGLPVAGPGAYPRVVHELRGGVTAPPQASELQFLEGLLLALARSAESELDSGRWSKSVETSAGPVTVDLAMPDLLRPVEASSRASGGLARVHSRATEGALADMHRLLEGKSFESAAEANAFLQANFDGSFELLPARTPREEAQRLVDAAYEQRGHRRRMQFARRALEIDPDCADAHVLLAEEGGRPERALPLWEQAESVARRVLGEEPFEELAGSFWGVLETRPFMRAKAGRAEALRDLERKADAVEHYQELLRLNPNDNQGVRDSLAVCLLEMERHEELAALLDRYPDDDFAIPHYVRALLAFRTEGPTPGAAQLLRQALRTNRHVPGILLGKKPMPPLSDSFSPGDKDEAALCVAEIGEAWDSTPGADDWLETGARGTTHGGGGRGSNRTPKKKKKKGRNRR